MRLLVAIQRMLFPQRALEEEIATHLIATQVGFSESLRTALTEDLGSDEQLGEFSVELSSCLLSATSIVLSELSGPRTMPQIRNILGSFIVRYAQGIARLSPRSQQIFVAFATEHIAAVQVHMPDRARATGSESARVLLIGTLIGISFGRLELRVESASKCAQLLIEACDQQILFCSRLLSFQLKAT